MMLLRRIDFIITRTLNETVNWTELQVNSGDDLNVRAKSSVYSFYLCRKRGYVCL